MTIKEIIGNIAIVAIVVAILTLLGLGINAAGKKDTIKYEKALKQIKFHKTDFVKIKISGQKGQVIDFWLNVEDTNDTEYRVKYVTAIIEKNGLVSQSQANGVSYATDWFRQWELEKLEVENEKGK